MIRKVRTSLTVKRAGQWRAESLALRLQRCSRMLYIYGLLSDKERDKVLKRITKGAQRFV